MNNRSKTAEHDNGSSMATFSLVAVIVVVGLIALFVWQPWNLTTPNATTTITQPGAGTTQRSTTTVH